MELGSKTHKQLLLKSIFKVAFKTVILGLVIGILLILPSIFRENTFSMGLAFLGDAVILTAVTYASYIAFKKYQKIIKPFNETYHK
jgi:O-antigen/teichoic acid export membrane protein